MAFHVPEGAESFFSRVMHRFRTLIRAHVIDVVTAVDVQRWLTNFVTDEARYLAAHMLNAATVRTTAMSDSALQNVAEVIVPQLLRDVGRWNRETIEDFERALRAQVIVESVRFMPVDGLRLDRQPGNSGDAIARRFRIVAHINERYMVRADDDHSWRQRRLGLMVFLDDLLGTGSQFSSFVREYGIDAFARNNPCVYVPLLACRAGIENIARNFPHIRVHPVEILERTAGFFSPHPDHATIWARDGKNSIADTRAFYDALMRGGNVGPESRHSLDLTLLLPDRSPNNVLRAIWSEGAQWQPLKRR